MRLLKKSEIVVLKAKEKQEEIKQGMQLAKRVDTLREVSLEEEKSLNDFRSKTIGIIHEEISKEESKLGELRKEVEELRQEIAFGMSGVYDRQARLEDKLNEVAKREEALALKEKALDEAMVLFGERTRELGNEIGRIDYLMGRAKEAVVDAEEAKKAVLRDRNVLEMEKVEFDNKYVELTGALERREAKLKAKEELNDKHELEIESKQQDLYEREVRLKDAYVALADATRRTTT